MSNYNFELKFTLHRLVEAFEAYNKHSFLIYWYMLSAKISIIILL